MARPRLSGILFLLFLGLVSAGVAVLSRLGVLDRWSARFFPRLDASARLSPGDFPAGVAAPVGEVATVPLRPVRIGFTPRGGAAGLLLATSGIGDDKPSREGLIKTAYAMDSRAVVFAKEADLKRALALGGEQGGVDLAAFTVDRLAAGGPSLRDAAPRTVLLLSRSRGQDAVAALGVSTLADLKGKRLAACSDSPSAFFALWLLTRAGLGLEAVDWVELPSALDAGAALREGRADAVAGLLADVELAAKDRGGQVLATSADAPHLLASVLVARGEFAARYPDAVRRVIRGLLDAGAAVAKDGTEAGRLLGEVAPSLGDPAEAIRGNPPATLKDNLAFFGLAGEAPVTYDELFQSASALAVKLGQAAAPLSPADTRDLGALKYVAAARGP